MSRSSIEWTDATWNPVRGCRRVSEGCTRCYAETFAARNLPEMRSPTTGEPFAVRTPAGPRWTGRVELIPGALDKPLHWRKPRRIFVNSMSDLFHESLPDLAINQVFAAMHRAPRHTYQVLTKRPARMHAWFRWARVANASVNVWPLPNVWLGVSVEDQATADERIPLLLQTPAAVRFISLEPQLAYVDLSRFLGMWTCKKDHDHHGAATCPGGLDWVIVGGESGPGARPFEVAWARSAVAQCRAAGVPVFIKQLGARPTVPAARQQHWDWGGHIGRAARFEATDALNPASAPWRVLLFDRKGGDMSEWPEDLRVREFPKVGA
jgi:protein gp37